MSDRVTRLDLGRLDAKHRTPSGAARVRANVTRTGVFTYRRADGTVSRELRHPDDVFKVDSIESLTSAVLVEGHPTMINPANWRDHAVGSVHGPRRDGRFLAAELVVHDPKVIEKIDAGQLVELSCGYECKLVEESGTYDGEKYDARQTEIVYNHVGMGPAGWGRAGSDVSLKFDGVGECEGDQAHSYTRGMSDALQAKVDSLTADVTSRQARIDALNAELAQLRTSHAEAVGKLEKVQGRADALATENADLKSRTDAKAIDALVSARVALFEGARRVLGASYKTDGKADRDVMIDVIKAHDPKFDATDKADTYLRGRFDATCEMRADANDALDQVRVNVDAAQKGAADEGPIAKAITKFDEDARNASTEPLTISRKKA